MSLIEIARKDLAIPVREHPEGSNRGREIDQYNALVGIPMGSPYCASSLSSWAKRASLVNSAGIIFPYTGSSQAIRRWFDKHGMLSWNAQDLLEWDGALGGWTNADGVHGHAFAIEKRLTTAVGKVVGIITIEGNTDLSGDREGQGVYSLKRVLWKDGLWYPVNIAGKRTGTGHKLWFCDTSAIAGGKWWQ